MSIRSKTSVGASRRRRTVALLGCVAAAATAVAGATLGAVSPAASAPPAGDCTAAYPIADLVAGQAVTGRTVSTGTTPEPFTGEVLGVLEEGIAPDLDMVMVRLTSPEIARVGGIWQGMSGSPVYAGDGRLIGAVSYGLAFGPSPVAGVTPFADMDDYLAATPAARVQVSAGQARTLASAAGVTRTQAANGFSQLRIPYGVSGVSASRLAAVPARPYRDRSLATTSATAHATGPAVDSMVAGGNVAATFAYGDITQGGVGTVTSVCGNRVVAFGHPMAFFGATTMGLHSASAIYVQEDPVGAPFKLANFGPRFGTITDDRLTGISGTFDLMTPSTPVQSTVTFGTKSRTGRTDVVAPIATADTTLMQILANHDRTLDGITKGSELQSWTITGKRPDGTAFSLVRSDRYASSDIAFEVLFDVADPVYVLSSFDGVRIDSVTVNGAVTTDARTWSLSGLKAKVAGKWKKIKARGKIDARAGKRLKLRAILTGPAGKRIVPVSVKVPTRANGSSFLSVNGGADYFNEGEFSEDGFVTYDNVDDFLDAQKASIRNDTVVAELFVEGRRSVKVKRGVSSKQDRVVRGFAEYRVRVR